MSVSLLGTPGSLGSRMESSCWQPKLRVSKPWSRLIKTFLINRTLARLNFPSILSAATNRLIDLQRLVPVAREALNSIEPGQVVKIR